MWVWDEARAAAIGEAAERQRLQIERERQLAAHHNNQPKPGAIPTLFELTERVNRLEAAVRLLTEAVIEPQARDTTRDTKGSSAIIEPAQNRRK